MAGVLLRRGGTDGRGDPADQQRRGVRLLGGRAALRRTRPGTAPVAGPFGRPFSQINRTPREQHPARRRHRHRAPDPASSRAQSLRRRPMDVAVTAGAHAWNGLALPPGARQEPDLVVIGVPFEGGAGGAGGASLGPSRVRELTPRLKTIDRHGRDASAVRLRDLGDIPTWRFDLPRSIAHLSEVYQRVFREVTVPVLTYGGDHSITYPIVAAAGAG
ncbi:arginase family protein, partial [Streptomyces angustmyceticus]|uniref:arginase family protein n=1 Tax=Streptomyces angustmyceticus TaxID=285578 RepID=UPI003D8D2F8F